MRESDRESELRENAIARVEWSKDLPTAPVDAAKFTLARLMSLRFPGKPYTTERSDNAIWAMPQAPYTGTWL